MLVRHQSKEDRAGPRYSTGQILPWDVLVEPGLWRQAEHPLGDDVPQDLRGAALDRVPLGAQVAVTRAAAEERRVFRAAHGPVVVAQALDPVELDVQPGYLLVQPGEDQLGGRALGARLARR